MMVNKSFSIYSTGREFIPGPRQQVFVEVGKAHFAIIVYDISKVEITAFELFDFKENNPADINHLFAQLQKSSKIFAATDQISRVFINSEHCLAVPTFKFNKEIAADYLNIVFGNNLSPVVKFEHLAINPDIINVFTVPEEWVSALTQHSPKITFHHTHSSVIKQVVAHAADFGNDLITVHFYNTYAIVAVVRAGDFQLIQSFEYHGTEDVIYTLLNITERLKMPDEQLAIQISGMIDVDFNLYRELVKYFKNVQVEKKPVVKTAFNLTEQPPHYYNPFFKLAL